LCFAAETVGEGPDPSPDQRSSLGVRKTSLERSIFHKKEEHQVTAQTRTFITWKLRLDDNSMLTGLGELPVAEYVISVCVS